MQGFTAELGASGSFCPRHITFPVMAAFFNLSDSGTSPYLVSHCMRNVHVHCLYVHVHVQYTNVYSVHAHVYSLLVRANKLKTMLSIDHWLVWPHHYSIFHVLKGSE